MDIIILGAIPHGLIAKESMVHIEKQAPAFTHLLQTHQAMTEWLDIETIGCTPYEYYQLKKAHYTGEKGFYAKGLGPLRYAKHFNTIPPHQPIYLMELTHVEIGQHSAKLYTADELAITDTEAHELFEHAKEVFAHSPYRLIEHKKHIALIDIGTDIDMPLLSPALMATGYLNDWYQTTDISRSLRNLLNELQMSWYEHPVNQIRQQKGLKPINSAWVYGGGLSNTLDLHVVDNAHILSSLALAHQHQDWGLWISELNHLDQQLSSVQANRYLLFGFDRIITLTPKPFWAKLLNKKTEWKQWWSQSK